MLILLLRLLNLLLDVLLLLLLLGDFFWLSFYIDIFSDLFFDFAGLWASCLCHRTSADCGGPVSASPAQCSWGWAWAGSCGRSHRRLGRPPFKKPLWVCLKEGIAWQNHQPLPSYFKAALWRHFCNFVSPLKDSAKSREHYDPCKMLELLGHPLCVTHLQYRWHCQ